MRMSILRSSGIISGQLENHITYTWTHEWYLGYEIRAHLLDQMTILNFSFSSKFVWMCSFNKKSNQIDSNHKHQHNSLFNKNITRLQKLPRPIPVILEQRSISTDSDRSQPVWTYCRMPNQQLPHRIFDSPERMRPKIRRVFASLDSPRRTMNQ